MVIACPVHACIWDGDTLASERTRFPGVGNLISGAFARHSKEFHEWRIRERRKDIASNHSLPEPYDDLAVSQHKLGDHKAAIATMLEKDRLVPGLHETYSNLGTFHIYTGGYPEELRCIDKALAINPNAHFGREKYQKWLVEWLVESADPQPAGTELAGMSYHGEHGYARYVARMETGGLPRDTQQDLTLTNQQRADAIRGVTGMIFFADYDNPLLMEALGDLLVAGDTAANLASLCYMHASLKAPTTGAQTRILEKCRQSGRATHGFDIEAVKKGLLAALTKGAEYNETVRQDELKWIAEGSDAAEALQKKYLIQQTEFQSPNIGSGR